MCIDKTVLFTLISIWNLIHKLSNKTIVKSIYLLLFLRNFVRKKFLQNIIKASVADFIFSKIPCFQHILLNTWRKCLKYENFSLRRILV